MISNVFSFLAAGPAYLHEAMHFSAARLMGLRTRIHVDIHARTGETIIDGADRRQAIVIALAPALVAIPLLARDEMLWILAGLLWLIGCFHDFRFVFGVIRSSRKT